MPLRGPRKHGITAAAVHVLQHPATAIVATVAPALAAALQFPYAAARLADGLLLVLTLSSLYLLVQVPWALYLRVAVAEAEAEAAEEAELEATQNALQREEDLDQFGGISVRGRSALMAAHRQPGTASAPASPTSRPVGAGPNGAAAATSLDSGAPPHARAGILFTLSLHPPHGPRRLTAHLLLLVAVVAPALGALLLAHVKRRLLASSAASPNGQTAGNTGLDVAVLNLIDPLHFAMAAAVRPLVHIARGAHVRPATMPSTGPGGRWLARGAASGRAGHRRRRNIGGAGGGESSSAASSVRSSSRQRPTIPHALTTQLETVLTNANLAASSAAAAIDAYTSSRGTRACAASDPSGRASSRTRRELVALRHQMQLQALRLDLLLAHPSQAALSAHSGMRERNYQRSEEQNGTTLNGGVKAASSQGWWAQSHPDRKGQAQAGAGVAMDGEHHSYANMPVVPVFGCLAWPLLLWLRWLVFICSLPLAICVWTIRAAWWAAHHVPSIFPTHWNEPEIGSKGSSPSLAWQDSGHTDGRYAMADDGMDGDEYYDVGESGDDGQYESDRHHEHSHRQHHQQHHVHNLRRSRSMGRSSPPARSLARLLLASVAALVANSTAAVSSTLSAVSAAAASASRRSPPAASPRKQTTAARRTTRMHYPQQTLRTRSPSSFGRAKAAMPRHFDPDSSPRVPAAAPAP